MKRPKKKKVKHLIYTSRPVGFDDNIVIGILESSRKNNIKSDITGALLYRQDLYFQFLEGPEDEIDKTYERIMEDTRHTDVYNLKESVSNRRLFSSWAMRGDPLKTWMWSHDQVKDGIMKRLSREESLAVFEKLSRDVDQFN